MNKIIEMSENIFSQIRSDFDSLWEVKMRGNTLEIVTPYTSVTNEFVSVYLTHRDNGFVISDGGWVTKHLQEILLNDEWKGRGRYIDAYAKYYHVKTTDKNYTYFYKITDNISLLSAYVYDMVFFSNAVINMFYSEYMLLLQETMPERLFASKVKDILIAKIKQQKEFSISTNKTYKDVGFNAILKKQQSNHLWLGMYITGSTADRYRTTMFKAATGFGFVRDNEALSRFIHISAVIDENATGKDSAKGIKEIQRYMNKFKPQIYNFDEFKAIDNLNQLFSKVS